MKKKFWLVLCMIACIFAMTACSSMESSGKATFPYDEQNLKTATESLLTQWNEADFETILKDNAQQIDPSSLAQYTEWRDLKNEIGKFDSITSTKFKEESAYVTVVLTAKYENDSVDLTVRYDASGQAKDFKFERTPIFIEQLPQSIVNVLAMIGIAFLAILLILGIVYALKILPGLFGGSVKGESTKAVDKVLTSISQYEDINLSDDKELVAVITAAIMASMGSSAPQEGLVVRSIKRKNTNNWNKA